MPKIPWPRKHKSGAHKHNKNKEVYNGIIKFAGKRYKSWKQYCTQCGEYVGNRIKRADDD